MSYPYSSLPHRQLRNGRVGHQGTVPRSLPHRQLRKSSKPPSCTQLCSLPHRQLRNLFVVYDLTDSEFTAA